MRIKGSIHKQYVADMVKSLRSRDMEALEQIDCLTDDARRDIRESAIAAGIKELPRILYFNYQTQEYIR